MWDAGICEDLLIIFGDKPVSKQVHREKVEIDELGQFCEDVRNDCSL